MKNANSTAVLASFATLKSLNDGRKYSSSYQLLAEFLNYIIYTYNLFSFSSIEMKNKLETVFGFDNLPEVVVKSAIKSLGYVNKKDDLFYIDYRKVKEDKILEETKAREERKSASIIDALERYIEERESEIEINKEALMRDLISFLVDGMQKSSGQYINLISEFILKNENNEGVQECLRKIREGSILYIGINYNISETGSFKKQLTLFLDTEILFSLVGFNGTIYEKLAIDFYNQVKAANANGEKIKLSYFPEVEREIEDFFKTAESIVDKKTQPLDKVAMQAITNGSETVADVRVKMADFFHKLKYQFKINKDIKRDYYTEEDKKYNLESLDYTESKDQESWRFISHINKLRKANVFYDNTEAEYLFITNTYNTLKTSKEYADKLKEEKGRDFVCDYAISLERVTNIIWNKLGNGFGKKAYPNNVDVVLRARIALASCITHNVEQVYIKAKNEFHNGEITEAQLAARIITLRKKPVFPEEIQGDLLDESMNFSAEYLSRFEEEVNANKETIKEKESIISVLKEQQELELKKKDETIAEREQIIKVQNERNQELVDELDGYRKRDEERQKRKEKCKRIMKLFVRIGWKLAIIIAITVVAVIVEKKVDDMWPLYACGVVDLCGLTYTAWITIKKDFDECFKSCT